MIVISWIGLVDHLFVFEGDGVIKDFPEIIHNTGVDSRQSTVDRKSERQKTNLL
jgi:hypothetical protein